MTPRPQQERPRVAILTNIIPPYRAPIYRAIGEAFQVTVMISGREDNRHWMDAGSDLRFNVRTAWGFTVKRELRRDARQIYDLRYTHINPGFAWELLRLMPHAVVSHEMGFRTFVALAYGIAFHRPVWVWWGGTLHTERQVHPAKTWMRRHILVPLTAHWISYGRSSTEYLLSLGVARSSILQIQDAVDESRFSRAGAIIPLDAPRPRVLFVGQLIARKGLAYLLDAAARLCSRGVAFSLIVVGDGPEGDTLKQQALDQGLSNVWWIPHVDSNEMPLLYRACDVLVFPTLEDVWGLVVNEALLCGLPVLASRYAGCAEELLPPERVFDPLDVDGLANLLARTLAHDSTPPDLSRIVPIKEVAAWIVCDIQSALEIQKRDARLADSTGSQR